MSAVYYQVLIRVMIRSAILMIMGHLTFFIKQEYIALWLAMILLAAQQHLGVIADMLSILVNLFHLRQIVTSWKGDDA